MCAWVEAPELLADTHGSRKCQRHDCPKNISSNISKSLVLSKLEAVQFHNRILQTMTIPHAPQHRLCHFLLENHLQQPDQTCANPRPACFSKECFFWTFSSKSGNSEAMPGVCTAAGKTDKNFYNTGIVAKALADVHSSCLKCGRFSSTAHSFNNT